MHESILIEMLGITSKQYYIDLILLIVWGGVTFTISMILNFEESPKKYVNITYGVLIIWTISFVTWGFFQGQEITESELKVTMITAIPVFITPFTLRFLKDWIYPKRKGNK